MYQDPFDEDFFYDSNTVPWESVPYSDEQHVVTSLIDGFDPDAFKLKSLTRMEEIKLDDLTLHDGCSVDETESFTASETSISHQREKGFPLMNLPIEIRLEIYKWLHILSPVKQAQLTPWYPTPVYKAYFLKRVNNTAMDSESNTNENGNCHASDEAPMLLTPYRPLAGIPLAFLTANSQIYQEIRELPFRANEFVFVNWFASGLWAARAFMKGMSPWQRDAMRYVRLELLACDLGGSYADEWAELCRFWSQGLRGLRIKILSGGVSFGSWVANGLPRKGAPTTDIRNKAGEVDTWVANGLAKLSQLRVLEVELLMADWDHDRKLEWCKDMEEVLNESMPAEQEQVRVVSVERDDDRTS